MTLPQGDDSSPPMLSHKSLLSLPWTEIEASKYGFALEGNFVCIYDDTSVIVWNWQDDTWVSLDLHSVRAYFTLTVSIYAR